MRVTTGESKGDPAMLNPEQLLLMAASSCQMLWFLHLAAKARVDVVAYEDDAEALMPEDEEPVRITEITLRPRITVDRRARARSACASSSTRRTATASSRTSLNRAMRIEPTVDRR